MGLLEAEPFLVGLWEQGGDGDRPAILVNGHKGQIRRRGQGGRSLEGIFTVDADSTCIEVRPV